MKFSNPPPNISSITIQKNFDLNFFFFRRALALNYNPFAINQVWTPLTPSKLTKSSAPPLKKNSTCDQPGPSETCSRRPFDIRNGKRETRDRFENQIGLSQS